MCSLSAKNGSRRARAEPRRRERNARNVLVLSTLALVIVVVPIAAKVLGTVIALVHPERATSAATEHVVARCALES